MMYQSNRKTPALLLFICMIFQMLSGNGLAVTSYAEASSDTINSLNVVLGDVVTYYVGGDGAAENNAGTDSQQPFAYLSEAANAINVNGEGNYNIIVQGNTIEAQQVVFGNSYMDINVTISSSALGSAIIMRGMNNTSDLIKVNRNVTLTLGDITDSNSDKLILDGGNYAGEPTNCTILQVNGTLNLTDRVTLQNTDLYGPTEGMVYSKGAYDIYLKGNRSIINVNENINNSETIRIGSSVYIVGEKILYGEETILAQNYLKFKIMDEKERFSITSKGIIKYVGNPSVYYVNKDSSDTQDGSAATPFATIERAIGEIDGGVGSIILQSDITLTKQVIFNGTINLLSDGNIRTIRRGNTYAADAPEAVASGIEPYQDDIIGSTNAFVVNEGKLILGNSDNSGSDEAPTLIFEGDSELDIITGEAFIHNIGVLNINSGVALQNCMSSSYGGIFGNGKINMFGGVIRNINAESVVQLYSGGYFNMSGGSIIGNSGNSAGIAVYGSSFVMSGGSISNNNGGNSAGVYAVDSSIELSGGSINGNTGSFAGVSAFGGTTLKISDDAIVSGGDQIILDNGSVPSYITIANPMSVDTPVLEVVIYNMEDSGGPKMAIMSEGFIPEFPVGRQVLISGIGYTFTARDAGKFVLTDPTYGINVQGKVGKAMKDNWVALLNDSNIYYNGASRTVDVTISDGTTSFIPNVDYILNYSNNINVGTASVTVTGIGDYAGQITKSFNIRAVSVPNNPIIPPVNNNTLGYTHNIENNILNVTVGTQAGIIGTDGNVTIPISNPDILNQVSSDGVNGVNITVTVPNNLQNTPGTTNIQLGSELLEELRDTGRDATISVMNETGRESYSWTFTGENLNNSNEDLTDVNLTLSVSTMSDNERVQLQNDGDGEDGDADPPQGLVVNFSQEGVLPSQAAVRIYVGDQEGITPGEHIYLYHYNPDTGMLETLPYSSHYIVDEDGYITVNILHCSDYVVLTKKADNNMITTLLKQIKVTPSKRTLYIGRTKGHSTDIDINLPETLEMVSSLQKETSQSAAGGVISNYRSGNSSAATVDEDGRITAKGVGKANIFITITLYSGKTKTFITAITVKKR